jgi:MarR family transcriptional regulator for hemolysin
MGPPPKPPVGLQLNRTARIVHRAFDEALGEVGGSLPVWLVLLNLKLHPDANQKTLADAVGVREATLTHHLNAMEKDELLTRRRDPKNRRIHIVELTKSGDALFLSLRDAAIAFDGRLRVGLAESDLVQFDRVLNLLVQNVGSPEEGPPWSGLADNSSVTRAKKSTPRSPNRK